MNINKLRMQQQILLDLSDTKNPSKSVTLKDLKIYVTPYGTKLEPFTGRLKALSEVYAAKN